MPRAKRVEFKGFALINIRDNFRVLLCWFSLSKIKKNFVCGILVKYRVLMMLACSNVKGTYSSAGE